jgi:putative toxin-antitoxin system antitoxin component (TIGR02293 family)
MAKKKGAEPEFPDPGKAKTGFIVEETSEGYSVPARGRRTRKTRDLGKEYNLSMQDFADVLEVTPKTLSRWKRKGEKLSQQQNDRITILESIFAQGERILGSRERMREWLHAKVLYLNGKKPVEMIKTEMGRRLVEEALHQIEFGMF